MFQHVLSTLVWLASAQGLNCLFAALCLVAAFGANPRVVMLLTALLYLAMARM
jgi:hypothetical protein